MASSDKFEEAKFMKELVHLKDTQEAIQSLSGWCIRNKKSAYKIARCWLKCIKKVKTEQKLALFHLLNDVVQHSKRKNHQEILEKFQSVVREAMPHLKDESIFPKIHRCLNIWAERQVFGEKFLNELMEKNKKKPDQDIVDNFQPHQLCTQIKIMKALEDDTDYKLQTLNESDVNLVEMDEAILRQNLKDRQLGNDYINEVDDSRKRLEQYIKAIDREITKRRQVKDLLEQGKKYYDSLLGEANIVATAYTNFGKRVLSVNRKLETQIPELEARGQMTVAGMLSEADLSPIPSPDYDAPSPEPNDEETELTLPGEESDSPEILMHKKPADLASRIDSFRTRESAASGSGGGDLSFSEYLTKIATGESLGPNPPALSSDSSKNGPENYDNSNASWWAQQAAAGQQPSSQQQQQLAWPTAADPPPATSWPPPKSDWPADQENAGGVEPWDEPIPEWQIQPEDEEPPDEDQVTQNLALARLQQRSSSSIVEATPEKNNLIDVTPKAAAVDMDVCSDGEETGHAPISFTGDNGHAPLGGFPENKSYAPHTFPEERSPALTSFNEDMSHAPPGFNESRSHAPPGFHEVRSHAPHSFHGDNGPSGFPEDRSRAPSDFNSDMSHAPPGFSEAPADSFSGNNGHMPENLQGERSPALSLQDRLRNLAGVPLPPGPPPGPGEHLSFFSEGPPPFKEGPPPFNEGPPPFKEGPPPFNEGPPPTFSPRFRPPHNRMGGPPNMHSPGFNGRGGRGHFVRGGRGNWHGGPPPGW